MLEPWSLRFQWQIESFLMNTFFKRVGSAGALTLVTVGSAFAAVPADVTTAISDMKTDGLIVAGAVLVAVIAIAAIKFLRRAM